MTLFEVLRSHYPNLTFDQINISFNDLGIDSYDLLEFRLVLEESFNLEFPEDIWNEFRSFKEIEIYYNNLRENNHISISSGYILDEKEISNGKISKKIDITLLRNYSAEIIGKPLKQALFNVDIDSELTVGEYNSIGQEVFSLQSSLYMSPPDFLVLSIMLDTIAPNYRSADWDIKYLENELLHYFTFVSEHLPSVIIVNTFIDNMYSEPYLTPDENSIEFKIEQVNSLIKSFSKDNPKFFVVDWNRILRVLGEERCLDLRYWYLHKIPFKSEFFEQYAEEIVKIIQVSIGMTKKCLILDCDETLWGGILGEVGLQGIELHPEEYPGSVYFAFQRGLLQLFERGILLCLCSKNNELDVLEVLDSHPYSLIRKTHLSTWKINWDDKVKSILDIVNELNISLDSCVFVDDSPFECEVVKKFLPEIVVYQVPKKLYNYPDLLQKKEVWGNVSYTFEDKNRTKMYQDEWKRTEYKKQFYCLDDFLESLNLKAFIHIANTHEIPRIFQLNQKTNQFNLTTFRFNLDEIQKKTEDNNSAIFTLSVEDKFGALGIVGVFFASKKDNIGKIENLLISCRALGRRLEYVFVNHCMKHLELKWNVQEWFAEYCFTKKNQQVSDFWENFGFQIVNQTKMNKIYKMKTEDRIYFYYEFVEIIEE